MGSIWTELLPGHFRVFMVRTRKPDMHVSNPTASRSFNSSTCYFQKLLDVQFFLGKKSCKVCDGFFLLPWKALSKKEVIKVDQTSGWRVASPIAAIFSRYVPLLSRLIHDCML